MEKKIKIWKKQEKRIVKLLYKKGLLNEFKIEDLYWQSYRVCRIRKKKHGQQYRMYKYYPDVNYSTTDYWGECDEHSLVSTILDQLYWENSYKPETASDESWPESTFKFKGRNWFIKYLEALPTVNNNSKINKILKFNNND